MAVGEADRLNELRCGREAEEGARSGEVPTGWLGFIEKLFLI
jgi:hypothetical protein